MMKTLLISLLTIILFSFDLHAEAFDIENYEVTIDLREDGSFRVRETITVQFSEKRHGIFRSIPYRYRVENLPGAAAIRSTTKDGIYETLLKDVNVRSHPFQFSKEGNYLKIRIGSPSEKVIGKQIYEIEYTVYGAINQFPEHQEFSWNLTGNEWDTSIDQVNYTINLPKNTNLTSSDIIGFTGRRGSKAQDLTWDISNNQIKGSTSKKLKSKSGASLSIRLPVDYFSRTEIPLTAYASHYYIKNHHAVYTVKNNTAVDVLETYEIKFIKPTNRISRLLPAMPRDLPDGGTINTVLAEEELLAGIKPNQEIEMVVSRRKNMNYISVLAKEKAFTGTVQFQFRYQLWGTAMQQKDQANFMLEIAHLSGDEPIENSSFEINLPENVQMMETEDARRVAGKQNIEFIDVSPSGRAGNLSGKTNRALVHNPNYKIRFTTDTKNLDFSAPPLDVYAQHYYTEYFKTDIYLEKDGTARVEYGLEPQFFDKQNQHEFLPYIQTRYEKDRYDLPNHGFLAKKYKPLISEINNPDSEAYELVERADRSYFRLKFPYGDGWNPPFTYSYKIDGIQTTEDGLYKINFPVIYPGDEPVKGGSFRVHFPEGINAEDMTAFAETSSGREVGRIDIADKVVTGIVDEMIMPGEAVVLTLLYPKSYTGWKLGSWLKLLFTNNFYFIIAFVGIALLGLLWYFLGRDEKHSLQVRFKPPADITSAEAGLLWDGKLHKKDLISLIYYWAADGLLKIREENFGGISNYILIKRGELPTNAKTFERTIFNKLFSHGEEVSVSSLRDSFYTTLRKAHKELERHGKETGFYVKGSRGIGILLIVGGIAGLIGSIVLLVQSFMSMDFSISVPMLLLSIAAIFFGYYMPKKAPFGAERFREILGFREFIKTAEIDRLRELAVEDPKYFEDTIAYAIVFGMGTEWASKFKDLSIERPDWYQGSNNRVFHPVVFTDNMMSSMNRINTDLTYVKPSSNSSSGGSSFGGGGSSGGGFGGGGGSSW